MSGVMILDIETCTASFCGAKASPRHPDNYVVMVGQRVDNPSLGQYGKIEGVRFNSKAESLEKGWLHIPEDVTMLVCHNAPFEMDWALVQQRDAILAFLRRGGRVFCTAYAEYLLSNQQDTYPSLNETAPKYGGNAKVDAVKLLWDQGINTPDIDPQLLADYLLGTDTEHGDIGNTALIFYAQWAQLAERGMLNMALGRMEGMVFNCFAMASGLYVNQDVANSQRAELEVALAEHREAFAKFRENYPGDLEFKESSDYHMSAWLYGGPIKYRARVPALDEDGNPKYEKEDYYLFEGGAKVPVAVADTWDEATKTQAVMAYGPLHMYKSGKNKGMPKVFRMDSDTPKMKWGELVFNAPGLIPWDVLPKDFVKEWRNDNSGKRKLSDDSPVYSTGKDALEPLSKQVLMPPGVKTLLTGLLEYFKMDKDLGTYYLKEVLDEEGNVVKQSGMLQYVTPYSIVHHLLNCTSTVTGRLSSNRPNMQNIPRGDTSNVKKMFTSRFQSLDWCQWAHNVGLIDDALYALLVTEHADGKTDIGSVIEADYSALEVVCLAAFSNDPELVRALLEGIDMHCLRLSKRLNEPYEDVLRKCKDSSDPDHERYKTMRTEIKPPAFAYQYGATAQGIAFATGMPVEEAEEFIANEKALFPVVESWYSDVVFAKIMSNCTTHREQYDEGRFRVYRKGVYQSDGGTTYEFREYPKTKWVDGQKIETMEFKPTQMRNYIIQGDSGFFVQVIAGRVMRWLLSRNFFDGRVWIINQVHDAIYLDVHHSVLHEVAHGLKAIMESLPEVMREYGYNLQVPFPAEVEAGPSMFDKEKVK